MVYLVTSIPIWLLYLAMTANFEPSNLVLGLLISIGVAWLAQPESIQVDLRRLPAASIALARSTSARPDAVGDTPWLWRFKRAQPSSASSS